MFRVYKTDKTSFYYFYFPNPWINGQLKYRLKLHTEQHWTSNHVKVKASNPMEIYSCSKKKWPKSNFSLLRVTSQAGGVLQWKILIQSKKLSLGPLLFWMTVFQLIFMTLSSKHKDSCLIRPSLCCSYS